MKCSGKVQASLDMIEGFFILETEGATDEGNKEMGGSTRRTMDLFDGDINGRDTGVVVHRLDDLRGPDGQYIILNLSAIKE